MGVVALIGVASSFVEARVPWRSCSLGAAASIALTWLIGGSLARQREARKEAAAWAPERGDTDSSPEEGRDAQAHRDQKMDAIGRLAGTVAHEFNDMLSIVLGYSGIALDGMRPEDPMYGPLSEIKRAGERWTELTKKLLSISFTPFQEMKRTSVTEAVERISPSLRRVLGPGRELVLSCPPTRCQVRTARGQVEQVVMILILNARDALPDGGTVRLEVRRVEVSPAEADHERGSAAGPYVQIRVADDGVGMPPSVLEHVFEPYFTTKSSHAGLGLATAFGVARQNGGHIAVESAPGKGTRFDVFLPEARSDSIGELPSSGTTRAARTILLVGGEDPVRLVIERILRGHRYGVLVASTPQEAMSIGEKYPGRIDLLVTDESMPTMSGPALAQRLCERRPEMKALFMSGCVSETTSQEVEKGIERAFLAKPVTPELLRQAVRKILRNSIRPASLVPPSHHGNA
jgi:two-component system, cell cycle sensor histidine kinase and response regulator CckA